MSLESLSECTLCAGLGRDHVPSSGDPMGAVAIVGYTPNSTEVVREQPMCGDTGALLDLMLEEAGLSRPEVYTLLAVKCQPPGQRPPSPDEITNCRNTWMKPELANVKARIVVILGRDAFNSLKIPAENWGNGSVVRTKKRIFYIMYHPSYFLRRSDPTSFIKLGSTLRLLVDETNNG